VIGNPPYIGEKGHKELFEPVKQANLKKFYMGKMDYFYFFFHLALEIGKLNSQVAFISTNYYITATGAVKLRKDLHERATINKLVNFNELKIFESATGQHNMITLYSKGTYRDKVADTCITHRTGFASPQVITRIFSWTDDKTEYFKVPQNYLYDGNDFQIRLRGTNNLTDNSIVNILNKIQNQGLPLEKLCNINQGIVTGADKVSRRYIEKYKIKSNLGDGIFVLKQEEILELKLNEQEIKLIKPWFKNSDIYKYYTKTKSSNFVILSNFIVNLSDFPNIEKHLSRFELVLKNRSQMEHCLDWWDLHQIRMKDKNKTGEIKKMIFDGPKIVAPQRSYRNTFGYNEIPWYASSGVYFITEKDKDLSLKYLLALLNSQLYYLWLYFRGKRKGKALELVQKPLSEIPIMKINAEKQKPFIEKVDQILALVYSEDYPTNKTKQEQVKALENELNQMVYDLYGLSEEEKSIVENFKPPKGSIESH
jgi:adenine-specific DNA-methyltransferase